MASSNLIRQHLLTKLWLFVASMFAFSAFIIVLVFYLAKAHPEVLNDTLKLLYLQTHDFNALVMKVDGLQHRIQSLENEVEVLKAAVNRASMETITDLVSAGLLALLTPLLIVALKDK